MYTLYGQRKEGLRVMFRSSFYKYLTGFVIIIFISFIILSGIITTMIRNHVTEDKIDKLELASSVVADYFEGRGIEKIDSFINAGTANSLVALIPIVNIDYDFNILITDAEGKVLLSTVKRNEDNLPSINGELGNISISSFKAETHDEKGEFLVYKGVLPGITDSNSLVYGDMIRTGGALRGYVFAVSSTTSEDRLISVMRRTVINSSLLVMLAAVIATYFITERIIHPLKSMTKAAKKFAGGDFSERVTVTGRDEIAELGIAFNNMADSLDNLEKMRNSFLANVSHDLRTPMTTISGFIDGINSGAIPKEQHEHYLGVISSEVHRLSRLVSQLLDLSRIESGDRKFNFTDFDIAEIARLIIISFEKQLEDKRLDVEFETDEDSMIAFADKDAIYQVLYNLVHNAIKFAKDGGKFRISIKKKEDKKILVSVFDEGQSISEEDKARIFERFYKTDKSRGLDKHGVGLGLYICKTIIDAHKEQLGLNTENEATEFWFTLRQGDRERGRG